VAKTLGVREASGRPLEETLLDVLRGNELLLLMDNCEHVVSQCSELIETILEECPGIRVLATSRELLKVAGEKVWRVPSLQFPGEEDLQGSDSAGQASLLEYDSLRLFVERAAQMEPGFRIDARDIRATAQICRRLDGIPLAIELAAPPSPQFWGDVLIPASSGCARAGLRGSGGGVGPGQAQGACRWGAAVRPGWGSEA
jgi:non-specific serine/threonine protein kinase